MSSILKKHKTLLIGIGTTLVSTALMVWCFRKVNWQEFFENVEHAKLSYLVLGALVTASIVASKALQLRVYLPADKKITFRQAFRVVGILLMTVSILPFWGGHALFVYLLGEREKVGKTVALSVITLDQILDGFGKLAVFLAVVLFVPLPEWMHDGVMGFVALLFVTYTVAFVLAYRYRKLPDLPKTPAKGFRRILQFFREWAYHLRTLRDPKKVVLVIAYAIFFRVQEVLAVWLVGQSFGVELPFYSAILVVAAFSLATVLPMAPGRLGVFEAAVFTVYRYLGVDPTLAITLALFVHLVHSLPLIITGYIVSIQSGFKRKELPREAQDSVLLASNEL